MEFADTQPCVLRPFVMRSHILGYYETNCCYGVIQVSDAFQF